MHASGSDKDGREREMEIGTAPSGRSLTQGP